ncbi:MAG: PAS domain S-box protein, partial [Mariprofundaceae bacterium]|nr:PAS domain S-box protein [Mariprofundaceae bacterium]
ELHRQLDTHGRVFDYRIRLRHKDGRVLRVSVNSHVYHDAQGAVAGVEGTFRDVSDLSKVEEKLQTLALAVENSPTRIIITDSKGSILHVNPAYEQISGYSSDETLGKNPRFQNSGKTPVETYRDMWASVTAGKTWRGEFLNRRKNGELYCQSAAIAPVRGKHGEIIFYVAVQEDISERKRTAEALEQARKQADAANAAKSSFLTAASHDLRQPLQAMRLYLDVLAERMHEPQEKMIVGKLQMVHADVGGMLDRLLDMSRLDAGDMQPVLQPFDLGGILRDLHEQYQAPAEQAGLELRLHHLPDLLWIDSDPVFVKEILSNLLSNAIRHTQRGGILLATRRRSGKIRLEVWDSGKGIEPDRQKDIFQEFVQLGNPERDRRKGVGLGLSIASRMSRLLGSHIALKSRPGRGSVFSFDLPLVTGDAQISVSQVEGFGGRGFEGRLVFVIDDDPQMRDSLGMMLEQWRCMVMSFGDGESALAAAQEGKRAPDAVIADYRLRDNATGVQAILALHAQAGHSIPALLLTGDTEALRMQEATEAGFPLLHKPVAAHKLGLFLERHISTEDV